jgi:hypothetical protein
MKYPTDMKYAGAYYGKIFNNSHNFLPKVKNFIVAEGTISFIK